MNRIDRAVVGGLVLILVVAAIAIGVPALVPGAKSSGTPVSPSAAAAAPYREGVLGHPTTVNPLAARTQADRDLVALVFQGLVGRDADGRPTPDLARSWTSSPKGDDWTFRLDPEARWQDGEPVTSADVVYTIRTIQDPEYHGPGAGSWMGITVAAVDATTVEFKLTTAIGGFLDLATQPIVPEHLLSETPPASMQDASFGDSPIGSGPYAVVELDRDHAVLELASIVSAPATEPSSSAGTQPGDPLATTPPTARPNGGPVGLRTLEFRFFDDADALATAFANGDLDVASGLDPGAAVSLAGRAGATTIRNPSTTLAAVAMNLRAAHVAFADPRTRKALLGAIDRDRIASVVYGGGATVADGLIPPSSWAFSAADTPSVARDVTAATKALKEAGWTKAKDGWHHEKAKQPLTLELLVPDRTKNPILFAVGSQIAADWTALGFAVDVQEEDPAVIATDHLRAGEFEAAVVDIALGHDPDLYPLLASSQTRTGGANVVGLQDPLLDDLLEAARKPGTDEARKAAFGALQKRLSGGTYLLPIAWPDDVVVIAKRVVGTSIRTVADDSERFFDVLDWRLADDR
ncbi:MAG TPA: peptide ABC transporter substrate-binding protein [Candidatus Limnocylindrales bacterium]|nr:peptide ABC transporter substrate-binding protein [Candidatus Limnocylindrales bacterium]